MNPTLLLYETCYRCRAGVPNALVKRRMMETGHSARGGAYHERVSLCGICDQELREEARRKGNASCRYWGVFWGTIALAYAGILWPIGLVLMLVFARYRMVGRALLSMGVAATIYAYSSDYPTNLPAYFVVPWLGAMAGQVGYALPWRKLLRGRPLELQRNVP